MRFEGYSLDFRIVSLALDEITKNDLIGEEVTFIYLCEDKVFLFPDNVELYPDEDILKRLRDCSNYDAFEIWPNGTLHQRYSENSLDNCLFITGRCNSNCIMCPSPEATRKNVNDPPIEDLIELVGHISSNTQHLTITGGEPFMAGERIFDLLDICRNKFKRTQFLILSNGRIFSSDTFLERFLETAPDNTIVAIPIHASCKELHDEITRVEGSFNQTVAGIKKLLANGIGVEVRVVLSRLNIADFDNIAELIISEFPGIQYVSIIAMEMTGNAYKNRDNVWISYKESILRATSGILKMINEGVSIRLYNFPLCTVDKKLWNLCEKSISPEKIRYDDKCNKCSYKSACGGVFAGTIGIVKDELEPIT